MHYGKPIAAAAAISVLLAAAGARAIPSAAPAYAAVVPPGAERTEFTLLSAFAARSRATGALVRIFPTRETFEAFRQFGAPAPNATSTVKPLQYFGGAVQTAPKVYVIFWGPAWNSTAGDPYGEAARMKAFFAAVGGGRWLNTVTQYTQSGGQAVGNPANILVKSIVDTGSSPPSGPNEGAIANEALRAASYIRDYSANASYVIALPHGIKPPGFGSQFCAYHSSVTAANGRTIAFTNDPYFSDAGYSCGVGAVNHPGTLDGVSIVGGHEQAETETDPYPDSGWLDANAQEIGDKCAWINLLDNPYAGGFATQPLFSNASNSCVQSY